MNEEEIRYAIALTYMTGFNFATALILYRELGGAKAIYDHRNDIRDVVPLLATPGRSTQELECAPGAS